ncbi:hypothetical protein [Streptomyces sp. NPDC055692]|uniref:hypothetical protein n=1 Tax=Streptomyces sp. NPDC055692 TaxID=3155683 RepID=UPI0034375056
MSTVLTATVRLQPTADPTPVEQAVADSIADGYPPETYLGFAFYRADGGCRLWHGWTDGGPELGDQVDRLALAAGLDTCDWLHIGDRHSSLSHRGRIRIEAYPLRPILADVQGGERGPEGRRQGLLDVIAVAAARTGQRPRPGLPAWPGFGPARVLRKASR